jgi:predicted metalloprotease
MLTIYRTNESRNGAQTEEKSLNTAEKEEGKSIETILVDTEDVWGKIFRKTIWNIKTKISIFKVCKTECGNYSCFRTFIVSRPKVYMDLTFFLMS